MFDDFQLWVASAALALSTISSFYSWLTSRSRINSAHLEEQKSTLINHDRRLQSIESELNHMPAKDDITALKLALAKLEGTVGRLDESLGGMSRSVRRVEDYLAKEK